MKVGRVVSLRLNPRDCQSVLDLMSKLNVDPYDGRGFPQCVSLALASMLESFRKNGVLPEPDPFQYMNRMAPLVGGRNDKRKYRMGESLYEAGGRSIGVLEMPSHPFYHPGQYIPEHVQEHQGPTGWTENGPVTTANVPLKMDEGTRDLMLEELKGLYDKSNGGQPFTPEEKARFDYLNKELYS